MFVTPDNNDQKKVPKWFLSWSWKGEAQNTALERQLLMLYTVLQQDKSIIGSAPIIMKTSYSIEIDQRHLWLLERNTIQRLYVYLHQLETVLKPQSLMRYEPVFCQTTKPPHLPPILDPPIKF